MAHNRTDYNGLAPWEVPMPQLEEYSDGWVGCSICLQQWTHKFTGAELAQEWRGHLRAHMRGER